MATNADSATNIKPEISEKVKMFVSWQLLYILSLSAFLDLLFNKN